MSILLVIIGCCFITLHTFGCYIRAAFSYRIAISLYYTAFLSLITRQVEVWSSTLVLCNQSTNSLFIISQLRGYIARYICTERTCTRIIYIAFAVNAAPLGCRYTL